MGYSSLLPFCFIKFTDFNTLNPKSPGNFTNDYPLYFIPVGVIIITSIILLICTALQIFVIQKAVSAISSQSQTAKAMKRVFYFVVALGCIITTFLEWRFEIQAQGLDTIEEITTTWYTCKIKQELGLPDPGYCPQERTPNGVQYGHLVFLAFLTSNLGVIAFLAFGLDKENYHTWPLIYDMMKRKIS